MQKIVEAFASLRDSLSLLVMRSFPDDDLFDDTVVAQFRSNELAKKIVIALAGGGQAPADPAMVQLTFEASGKVAIATPRDRLTVLAALSATADAFQAVERWLASLEVIA